jgi:hypothetical protein
MALTALGVAQSSALGYIAITQIMLFNARPDWFAKVSEGNMDLQDDVMNTYKSMCWCHDCLMDQHFEILLDRHIKDNWQAFFSSSIMPVPMEGH